MRTKGMTGALFSNHFKVDGLSKSVGNTGIAPTTAPIASGVYDPPDGEVGIAYYYACAPLFTGGRVETYSLGFGSLPAGLSIGANNGVISGVPTTVESTGVSILGTNRIGSDDTDFADIDITLASLNILGGNIIQEES